MSENNDNLQMEDQLKQENKNNLDQDKSESQK